MGTSSAETSRRLLARPRFELMPFESIEAQVSHLPDDATITITTSPTLGFEKTIVWSERLAEEYDVIPHVAARYVRDRDHLTEIADRLLEAGITKLFVPGGDREEPVGEFESAYQFLDAMDELGYAFDEVGITGYPEGHPFLDEDTLAESMRKKAPYATYITTQICYDPEIILAWIDDVRREREIDLPVEVGIPGVMKYQRLIGISRKVGVGDSVRFLRKTTGILGFVRELFGAGGTYMPDALVDGIEPHAADPHYNIRAFHIYTFNQVPDTEAWRRNRLRR